MGLIAFLLLGLIATLLMHILLPDEHPVGLLALAGIGMAGGLFGGLIGAWFFEITVLDSFYAIAPWMTAIFGALIALMTFSLYAMREEPVLPRRSRRGSR